MTRHRTTTIAFAAALTMLTLAGCTPPAPEPTKSSTPTPTATPTPSADAPPTQEPVEAPADLAAAIAGASTAYSGFLAASLDLKKNPSLGADYLNGYVLEGSAAWTVAMDTIRLNQENGITVSGGPFEWALNETMSYTAPSKNPSTGEAIENGSAVLFGCVDNTAVEITGADLPKGSFPVQVQLVFIPDEGAWIVQSEEYMTGEGAPLC